METSIHHLALVMLQLDKGILRLGQGILLLGQGILQLDRGILRLEQDILQLGRGIHQGALDTHQRDKDISKVVSLGSHQADSHIHPDSLPLLVRISGLYCIVFIQLYGDSYSMSLSEAFPATGTDTDTRTN